MPSAEGGGRFSSKKKKQQKYHKSAKESQKKKDKKRASTKCKRLNDGKQNRRTERNAGGAFKSNKTLIIIFNINLRDF